MNITDDILEIVRTTPISNMDLSFVKTINPVKVYDEMESRTGYKVLIETMTLLYGDAIDKKVDIKHASAVILATFEEILRYVIMKAVKERLSYLQVEDVLKLDANLNSKILEEKMENSKKELKKLEEAYKTYADTLPVNQFRYSLLYAGDRWGDQKEKKVIKNLVEKIKEVEVKK